MRAQNHALLAAEIEAFQTAARRHRDLRSYIGGCSNIAAFGSASTDGTLWHGRNFDFGGHGVLDEFRVVYIVEPEGKIPYVTVSWSGPRPWNYEGVHTAMNASGLSLGYMISQAEGESINDAPSPWELYRKIMEDTETIDQAVDVLRASPRRGAANLLLADGKVPEAVVVEMSSKAIAVRRALNDTVHATNHFVSPELFNPENKDSDSEARFQRLNELAGSRAFDLALTVSALRDRVDIHTRSTSPDGDIIGNPLNMLSVIFHPGDLTFWVASGAAPSSYRSFVGFNLTNELDGTPGQTDLPNIGEDETLDAASRAEIDAYQSGRRAYGRGDDAVAVNEFSKAVALNPTSSRYGYGLAGALINLERYDEAIAALSAALQGDPKSGYRAYIYYRLGQIYEKQGQTGKMRAAFEQVLLIDVGDQEIESYARGALGR